MKQKISTDLYCEFINNDDKGFAAILRRAESEKSEIGLMYGYFDDAYHGVEDMLIHWKIDCYISKSYTTEDKLLEIADFVIKNTKCKEPYVVQINWVDWGISKSKAFGKVFDDENE